MSRSTSSIASVVCVPPLAVCESMKRTASFLFASVAASNGTSLRQRRTFCENATMLNSVFSGRLLTNAFIAIFADSIRLGRPPISMLPDVSSTITNRFSTTGTS